MVQTAEGAANEVSNILKRMRELAVQSSSDTLDNTSRGYADTEYKELAAEITRIADTTEFNGQKLTNNTNKLNVQVGLHGGTDDRIEIQLASFKGLGLTADISSAANGRTALGTSDTALDTINSQRSTFGSVQNRLESALSNIETYTENLAASASRIRDADFAYETAELSKYQIMQQALSLIHI